MADFKLDKNALAKVEKAALAKARPAIQKELDRLARSHKGRSVDSIKRELKSSVGGMDDKTLTNIAQAIAAGTPVKAR